MLDTNLPITPLASPTGTFNSGQALPAVGSPEYVQSQQNALKNKSTTATATSDNPIIPPSQTGMDDNSYLSFMNGLNSNLQQNNSLVTQKNLIQKQLFDQPLTPEEVKQLPPEMQTVISSNNPDQMRLQLKIINDTLQGRNDSVAKSIGFLTTSYEQNQKDVQSALGQLESYATNNGLKLGDLVGAMEPIIGKSVADQLKTNLSTLNYPYIKAGLQPSASADNSGTVVDGYNLGASGSIGAYATDPNQPAQVRAINDNLTQQFGVLGDEQSANSAIQSLTPSSPVTGAMVMSAAHEYGVDPGVLISVMQNDSQLGTQGVAVGTLNPGNVGNTGTSTKSFSSWQDGVNAVAKNLAKRAVQSDVASATPPDASTADVIDPTTHVSPNGIYAAAVDYAFTGKMPSLGLGAGVGPSTIRGKILSIAGAISANKDLSFSQMRALYTADASAAKQNVERLARVSSIENSLINQFPRLGDLADKVKSEGINLTEQDVQAGAAAIQAKFGSPDAAAYIELLNTVRADYAAQNAALAGSRGGEFFANSAQQAIPLGYTSDQYGALSDTIKKSAENVRDGINQEVEDLVGTSGSTGNPGSGGSNKQDFSSLITAGIGSNQYAILKKNNPGTNDEDLYNGLKSGGFIK